MNLDRHLSIKRGLHENLTFTKAQINELLNKCVDKYEVKAVDYFDLKDDPFFKQNLSIFKHSFIPCGNSSIRKHDVKSEKAFEDGSFNYVNVTLNVEEMKNISHKNGRYFCYLWIDNKVIWKTTSKTNQTNTNNVLWFEKLHFKNIPKFSELRLDVYQKKESRKLSRRGSLSTLLKPVNLSRNSLKERGTFEILGSVTISWDQLVSETVDDWFLLTRVAGHFDGENHQSDQNLDVKLRLSVKMSNLYVLPIEKYSHFKKILLESSSEIFEKLESLVSAQQKDLISRCFVKLFEIHKMSTDKISYFIYNEIKKQDNLSMIFRQNSFPSKLSENFLKIFGQEYLKLLLSDLIKRICEQKLAWEVDPSKFTTNTQQKCSFLASPSQSNSLTRKYSLLNQKTNCINPYAEKIIRDYCQWNSPPTKHRQDSNKYKSPMLSTHLILAKQLSFENLTGNLSGNSGQGISSSLETGLNTITSSGEVCQSLPLVNAQCAILQYLDILWRAIQLSLSEFPPKVTELFAKVRSLLEKEYNSEVCHKVISSCLFLRFICPAILSPSLFNILSSYPVDLSIQKNLTLLSKALLSLTNFNYVNEKEPHMSFLSIYIECQQERVIRFLNAISLDESCANRAGQTASGASGQFFAFQVASRTNSSSSTSSAGRLGSASNRNSTSSKTSEAESSFERIVLAELHQIFRKLFDKNMIKLDSLNSSTIYSLYNAVDEIDDKLNTSNIGQSCDGGEVTDFRSKREIKSLLDMSQSSQRNLDPFSHQSHSMNRLCCPQNTDGFRESDYDDPFSSSSDHDPKRDQSPIYDSVPVYLREEESACESTAHGEQKSCQFLHSFKCQQIYENVEQMNLGELKLKANKQNSLKNPSDQHSSNVSFKDLNSALELLELEQMELMKMNNNHRSNLELTRNESLHNLTPKSLYPFSTFNRLNNHLINRNLYQY